MFYWDPNPDVFIIPGLNWPIKWYGLLFAAGFAVGLLIFHRILMRYFAARGSFPNAAELSAKISDQITLYIVVATIAGARLGHFLFYEKPADYLADPWDLLRLYKGGLASHGAAIAILIALWLFSRKTRAVDSKLTALRLLDFVCVPAAFAGGCIRIGNFINQEILGTVSNLPWAVVFGHPADGSFPAPRHPAQLYESLVYFAVFFLLWRLSFSKAGLLSKGRLSGLFLIFIFGFRLLFECFKLEQSRLVAKAPLITMGQWLSIPFILLGIYLLVRSSRDEME